MEIIIYILLLLFIFLLFSDIWNYLITINNKIKMLSFIPFLKRNWINKTCLCYYKIYHTICKNGYFNIYYNNELFDLINCLSNEDKVKEHTKDSYRYVKKYKYHINTNWRSDQILKEENPDKDQFKFIGNFCVKDISYHEYRQILFDINKKFEDELKKYNRSDKKSFIEWILKFEPTEKYKKNINKIEFYYDNSSINNELKNILKETYYEKYYNIFGISHTKEFFIYVSELCRKNGYLKTFPNNGLEEIMSNGIKYNLYGYELTDRGYSLINSNIDFKPSKTFDDIIDKISL